MRKWAEFAPVVMTLQDMEVTVELLLVRQRDPLLASSPDTPVYSAATNRWAEFAEYSADCCLVANIFVGHREAFRNPSH